MCIDRRGGVSLCLAPSTMPLQSMLVVHFPVEVVEHTQQIAIQIRDSELTQVPRLVLDCVDDVRRENAKREGEWISVAPSTKDEIGEPIVNRESLKDLRCRRDPSLFLSHVCCG